MEQMKLTNKSVALACCLSIGGLSLTGCQTSSLAKYDNPQDVCSTHRTALIQTEQDLQKPIIEGAVIGAVLGGLATGLITGNARAAVGGAVLGGLAGGSMGYYQSRQQQARNQAELVAAINGDAHNDAQRFSGVGASVKGLRECRKTQVATLRTQVQKKQIAPEAARIERDKIQVAIREDGELMNKVLGQVDSRVETYVQASQSALNAPSSDKALQNKSVSNVKQVASVGSGISKEVNTTTNEYNNLNKSLNALI